MATAADIIAGEPAAYETASERYCWRILPRIFELGSLSIDMIRSSASTSPYHELCPRWQGFCRNSKVSPLRWETPRTQLSSAWEWLCSTQGDCLSASREWSFASSSPCRPRFFASAARSQRVLFEVARCYCHLETMSIDQFIGHKSCRAACSSLCISIRFSVNDSDRSEGQSLCTGLLDFAFI